MYMHIELTVCKHIILSPLQTPGHDKEMKTYETSTV